MGAFAGAVRLDGGPVDAELEARLTQAVLRGARPAGGVRRALGAVFAARAAPTDRLKGAFALQGDGDALFAAMARLDNRAELVSALGPTAASLSDAELLERLYVERGEAGVAMAVGAFAFAAWDGARRQLTLGRDCLAQRPLLFHRAGDLVIFSNVLGLLLALPGVPRELDEEVLAHFLVLNRPFARRTFYRGVERAPGRALLSFDAAGERERIYWRPDPDAAAGCGGFEDYVARARELFDQAVAASLTGASDVAISLSGGLDSSAIAATAARLGLAERVTGYTLAPPPDLAVDAGPWKYADERDKVEALARMHPSLAVRILAPDQPHPIEEDDRRHFARAHLPSLGPTALGWTSFLVDEVLADRRQLLLVGAKGNLGLSWGGDLSLAALLGAGDAGGFARHFLALARETDRSLAQTFASDLFWRVAPRSARRLAHRLRGRDPDDVFRYSAINPAYVAQHGFAQRWREQGFDPWPQLGGWRPAELRAHLIFDRPRPHGDTLGWLDDSVPFDQRDPHADRRVLEFALATPEWVYRQGGVPRAFARAVFADRLPAEILGERRRGIGGGAWFSNLGRRRVALAEDIARLEGSAMARQLIDLPRLRRLVEDWPADEQAAYARREEYQQALTRALHIGAFILWVEGGNG
jgi:asparagine synthase (glutamine-hydrolysing)